MSPKENHFPYYGVKRWEKLDEKLWEAFPAKDDCIDLSLRIICTEISCWLVEKDPNTPFSRSNVYNQKA